ncbi:hypothetical protein LguiA_012845 [Lonicera macranthoides]
MQNMVCIETMMHLTCNNMPVEKIDHALDTIKSNDIQNVLALRGDPPHGQAYPDVIQSNGLATPESYQSDLAYLKKYCLGKLKSSPWSKWLQPETKIINEQLGDINWKGSSVSTANHQLMEQNLISHLLVSKISMAQFLV